MTTTKPEQANTNFSLLLIIVSDLTPQQVAGFVVFSSYRECYGCHFR